MSIRNTCNVTFVTWLLILLNNFGRNGSNVANVICVTGNGFFVTFPLTEAGLASRIGGAVGHLLKLRDVRDLGLGETGCAQQTNGDHDRPPQGEKGRGPCEGRVSGS
jgi:hypothetical protein